MEYQVVEFKYDPVGSFRHANPFTMAFCRTLRHGNVLVKGGSVDVGEHIATLGPVLVAYRFWHKGRSRGSVRLENCGPYYLLRREEKGRMGYALWRRKPQYEQVCWWRRCPSTFPRVLKEVLNGL